MNASITQAPSLPFGIRLAQVVMPLLVLTCLFLALQTHALYSQILVCGALAALLLSVLVLAPAFLERYTRMRMVYARHHSIAQIARRAQQRQQYYVLNYSRKYHQAAMRRAPLAVAA